MGLGFEQADAAVELGRSGDVLVLGGEGPDEGRVVRPDLRWERRVPRRAVGWGIVAAGGSGGLEVEWEGESGDDEGREDEEGIEEESLG